MLFPRLISVFDGNENSTLKMILVVKITKKIMIIEFHIEIDRINIQISNGYFRIRLTGTIRKTKAEIKRKDGKN